MKILKRGLCVFMAVLLTFSAFLGVQNVSAVGEQMAAYMLDFPRNGDENYTGEWGHGPLEFMNGWSTSSTSFTRVHTIYSYENEICYCIEPGVSQTDGDMLTNRDETFWDNLPSGYNSTISPDDIKVLIGRILHYGYQGTVSPSWRSQNEGGNKLAHATATQLLIWEVIVGERDFGFNKVDTGGKNAILEEISPNHPLHDRIMSYYNDIETKVKTHTKLPSFMSRNANSAQSVELQWDGSKYTVSLTDANNVLSNYGFTANKSGVSFSVNGNVLTVSANEALNGTVAITASKTNSQRSGVIVWTDGTFGPKNPIQDMVTYGQSVSDPVVGYMNIEVTYGSARIVKTAEDGKVDGISFRIQGNGIDKTVVTANGGEIQVDNLAPGTYTVTELPSDIYEPQESQSVTVISGQTSTITFNNTLRCGELTVTKTAEDGLTEGVKFHLYGTSLSGHKVDEYAVTDSSGKAHFRNILIGNNYTLEEVDTPDRYVVPDKQTVDIEWNKVTNKAFENDLKKWRITVTKSDSEQSSAQGDSSLAGAVYGIYKGEELIDSYTTDKNGCFTTKYYVCGDNWSLREITPSEGYLINTDIENLGVEPGNYTTEYNSETVKVYEEVRKGKISIIKHTDDGSTQIETPEVGAEFEVYLKSSGSYANAKAYERDHLTCDENGYAETKELPYGVYTVHQVSGWDGSEFIDDFDVFISEHGKTYRLLINNAPYETMVQIVKKDAETGKNIAAEGIGFKVRNTDTGEYVVQHLAYPAPMDIDTYYTDSYGMLMLPEPLVYGNYEIIEVQSAYGYVLDSDPVPFTIDSNSGTVITVEKYNTLQKGRIIISKSGEIFSSVMQSGDMYKPVYDTKGLAGAVYEVISTEDVYTLDGTQRYSAGEVVATITTDADGTASTEPLYLGEFKIREITSPYGMTLNNNPVFAELTYAGQEVSITALSVAFYNERQHIKINLSKLMEQDEKFGIGENGEILSVQFGLYAAESITASDGTEIPADGLIDIVSCNEDGTAEFTADIPVGAKLYVKEIGTHSGYVLSDEKYYVAFEYAGQDTTTVNVSVNDGEKIRNDIIYGTVKGLKIDRETNETIAGALFGLFRVDETEFTESNAILTAESDENGVFTFENVPFGSWIIRELSPAEGYLPNSDLYSIDVSCDEEIIEITVINERVPEIGTQATVGGEKSVAADGEITIDDVVSYKNLIPGQEYTITGVLMDKSTGEPFTVNGGEIHSEITFTPETSNGEVTVSFTFDASGLTVSKEIVVFESVYKDGIEIAVHADIEDDNQTVTVNPKTPEHNVPKTGESSNIGFLIGLAAVAVGALISAVIIYLKQKKDNDDE